MLSRMFWIFLTGAALVGGIALQERDWLFAFGGDIASLDIERTAERRIEARVEQAVERKLGRAEVVGSDGERIDVAPETKRELGEAVSRLIAAETGLAVSALNDDGDAAVEEARSRRDAARAEVERLTSEIERQEQLSANDRDVVRDQIRRNVRDTIRERVRSAVGS